VGTETDEDLASPPGRLRRLAKQILLLLTELSPEQLRTFGSFRVIDSVEKTELVPPTPIGDLNGE
jgi:hypothetical protein